MSKTGIAWTNETWNPVTGCTKVSAGCKNCYAETLHTQRYEHNQRVGQMLVGADEMVRHGIHDRGWPEITAAMGEPAGGWAAEARRRGMKGDRDGLGDLMPECYDTPFETVVCHEDRLMRPLSWRKPRMVFVNSMSDLFHADVPDSFLDQVFAVMRMTPHVIFQILTKRPERMREYLDDPDRGDEVAQAAFEIWEQGDRNTIVVDGVRMEMDIAVENLEEWTSWPPENVHLGTSVENQEQAEKRVPELLATPAAVRFLSCEPLLGPVNLRRVRDVEGFEVVDDWLAGSMWMDGQVGAPIPKIDWVIAGGESGKNARPANIAWFRSLRDQCAAVGVPFFMKQIGSKPYDGYESWSNPLEGPDEEPRWLRLRDRHGANPEEWPEDLRVREFPEVGR